MIEEALMAGPLRVALANSIRSVNAEHARVGGGEIPELKEAWVRLDKALSMATIAGDEPAARAAIDRYKREGLAAVADQADRVAAKTGEAR